MDTVKGKQRATRLNEDQHNLEQRLRERTIELETKHKELEALNSRIRQLSLQVNEAMENERRVLAKELHDSIGAGLAAIKFSLEQRLAEMDDPPCSKSLSFEQILSHLKDTITEAKRISYGLRPQSLDDLGLLPTIENHMHELGTIYSGIRFVKDVAIEETDVPENLKTVVFRVLQEALNNACRHSGGDTIHIIMKKNRDHLILEIRDNGRGFEINDDECGIPDFDRSGLRNMRDRTEICGGAFHVASELYQGTRVRCAFPRVLSIPDPVR